MAEKDKKSADFERYVFANVAAKMSKSKEDAMFIPGAINLLEKNLDFGEDGKDLYDQYVSDKATDKIIKIYDKKFNSKIGEASVADVYNWLQPALNGATAEQKAIIDSTFSKYSGENYRALMSKIGILQHKADTPEGGISEEERASVEEELKKYEGFITTQGILSKYNFESLRMQAIEASKPNTYSGLEQILKKADSGKDEGKK